MSETAADSSGFPPVVDFERLLTPISEAAPCGADPREDSSPTSPYYRIKDARNGARRIERQASMGLGDEVEAPDWSPVLKLAPEILATQAKDLEIAAWYVEALLRLHGFAGLRDGFRLLRELCERSWDCLYPLPDDEGLATRVAPITGLNGDDAEGTLMVPIRAVPITAGTSVGPYTGWQYEKAVDLERLEPQVQEERMAAGAVGLRMFNQAVAETPASFFRTLEADLRAAAEEWDRLTNLLDEKCGPAAPPSSNVRNALAKYQELYGFVTRDVLALQAGAAAAGGGAVAGSAGEGAAAGGGSGGRLATREDAFRELQRVAEYFRGAEPHSPVSYALEQAVRWGRMPLPDLLRELLPDETVRSSLFRLVGIRADEGGGAV